mmetsp:Transcript_7376/g.19888  ORF Transcript_7376/g.19888 Transcript_7376/m.19888 type:complete len:212 (-) Transcript_7376:57-692(-)
MAGFFRGTNTDQVKHVNAEQKIIKDLNKKGVFPAHYAKKVNMKKVSMDVMKPWIAKRITDMMGFEDEVVVEFCIVQLDTVLEAGGHGLDPKMLQVNMTGFMERKAAPFCAELWANLLSAQESPVGVPQEFIEKKKEDLRQKKEEADRVQEELKRRRKDLEEAARGGGREEAARGGGRSRSRSPPRRREERGERRRSPSAPADGERRRRKFD